MRAIILILLSVVSLFSQDMLPGGTVIVPAPAASGGGESFSLVQSTNDGAQATTTLFSLTAATTPVQNHLLILVTSSDATITAQTGWLLATNTADYKDCKIYYKIAGASESKTVYVTNSSSAYVCAGLLEYAGMTTSTPYDVGWTTNASANNIPAVTYGPTATLNQANELCVAMAGWEDTLNRYISSWTGSFATVLQTNSAGTTMAHLCVATLKTSSTTALSTVGTFNSSVHHPSGAIATFKIATP